MRVDASIDTSTVPTSVPSSSSTSCSRALCPAASATPCRSGDAPFSLSLHIESTLDWASSAL